ncbi:25S rRNA (adenine(645)-N(1))-methyltransferase [Leucoagaricus sp. SymC.cos]|nr:25S rRNA (adenine(645)-N(1))-methyltransferase [Leucoagaricus sp. SymC.cos]
MTLFEVPGWSVGSEPVQENGTTLSKKRKRPTTNGHQALEVNFDKIMDRLKDSVGGDEKKKDTKQKSPKKNKRERQKFKERPKPGVSDIGSLNISRPKPLKPRISVDEESTRPAKKAKTHQDSASPSTIASTLTLPISSASAPQLTPLQQGMKQSLDGARFRMINETLYKSGSDEVHRLMKEDPKMFEEYHVGFRHQVQSWPTNPVDHYIMALSSKPPRTIIADLGCGDAALAKALIPRGLNVLSYDLVSNDEYVIEADVFEHIPLPGSEGSGKEKTTGSGQVVDVVVCALSLMGTNWPRCLREAWRILKPEGELKVAEVTSRFTDVEEFQSLVGSIGFRFKHKDENNSHFTLFEFKKIARKPKNETEWAKLCSRGDILKPCEYKRR